MERWIWSSLSSASVIKCSDLLIAGLSFGVGVDNRVLVAASLAIDVHLVVVTAYNRGQGRGRGTGGSLRNVNVAVFLVDFFLPSTTITKNNSTDATRNWGKVSGIRNQVGPEGHHPLLYPPSTTLTTHLGLREQILGLQIYPPLLPLPSLKCMTGLYSCQMGMHHRCHARL